MYAEKAAASGGHQSEYKDKANEELKAAIKADPQVPATNASAVRLSMPLLYRPKPASQP
jgi:hypothetical protein